MWALRGLVVRSIFVMFELVYFLVNWCCFIWIREGRGGEGKMCEKA